MSFANFYLLGISVLHLPGRTLGVKNWKSTYRFSHTQSSTSSSRQKTRTRAARSNRIQELDAPSTSTSMAKDDDGGDDYANGARQKELIFFWKGAGVMMNMKIGIGRGEVFDFFYD